MSSPSPSPDGQSTQRRVVQTEKFGMAQAQECISTADLLVELKAKGVQLPDDVELIVLSKKLNQWLVAWREANGKEHSHSWFNLFNDIDQDHSGFVTYDELHNCVRHKLNKGPSEISEDAITALWVTLDADASNALHKDEVLSLHT